MFSQTRGCLLFAVVGVAGLLVAGSMTGCKGMGGAFEFLGTPFYYYNPEGQQGGPTTSGRQTGANLGGAAGYTDPCSEPQARKLVRISMRNQSQDYVHYFLVLIAYVNGAEYPTGGVCPDDVPLYTAFGYTSIPAGSFQEFGNYCVEGPALIYFHLGGQFRTAGGAGGRRLGSAIGPAQGASPTYDALFTSAGLTVPVPDVILFHNPGTTTEGRSLKVSRNATSPCSDLFTSGDPDCSQDAFYYVDDTDRLAGSTALGVGSGRRVPSEIQGTGCECRGLNLAFQVLAPTGRTATNARCDEFFRGGRIEYVFVRDDTDPPYPQLLWRVTDAAGGVAHEFDSRANVR